MSIDFYYLDREKHHFFTSQVDCPHAQQSKQFIGLWPQIMKSSDVQLYPQQENNFDEQFYSKIVFYTWIVLLSWKRKTN